MKIAEYLIYTVCFWASVVDREGLLGSYNGSITVAAENLEQAKILAVALIRAGFGIENDFTFDGDLSINSVYDANDNLIWNNEDILGIDVPEDFEDDYEDWHDDCDSWESDYAEGSEWEREQAEHDWQEFLDLQEERFAEANDRWMDADFGHC